jgi:hypothetical protein
VNAVFLFLLAFIRPSRFFGLFERM